MTRTYTRSPTQPRIFEMRQSPIRFLSIRRPYCNVLSPSKEELAVVAKAIDALLTVFDTSEIVYQFNLGAGCRPDLACFRGSSVLLVEVKARAVTEATVRQAARYLEAGRARWPDRDVNVVCVGTSLSARLGAAPSGIRYGIISAH